MKKLKTLFNRSTLLLVITGAIVLAGNAYAEEGDSLLGLTNENDKGYAFEAVYTGESFSNRSGGLQKDNEYLDNIDLTMAVDGERAFGIHSATLFFYVIGNNGSDLSGSIVGDAQGVSNIDTDSGWRLYEAWWDQGMMADKLFIKFGLMDLNSEFDVTETAGLFLNSSHGIGPDFSQSGQNGPSIFPYTSVALRALAKLGERGYVQAAVFDGVPGELDAQGDPNPHGTIVRVDKTDGNLAVFEAGYVAQAEEGNATPYTKLAIGFWQYSEESAHISDPSSSKNKGIYLIAERQVIQEQGDPTQGLALFLRYGVADEDINQFGGYTGFGAVYTGPFDGRDEDQLGLAIAMAENGDAYMDVNPGAEDKETAIELTYRAQITPWFALQPDIQRIIAPSTDPTIEDATVVGVRFEVVL